MMLQLLAAFFLSTSPGLSASQPPDAMHHTDFLAMNQEMKVFLDTNIEEEYPERRLRQLVYRVFNEDFLNLTYDNTRTKTAIETFQTRNGNCLSFTTMFVAMARHIGLDAHFQEVYIIPTWSKKGDTVMLSRHMNAVVVIDEKKIEVDFNPYQERKESSKKLVGDYRALAQYYNNVGCEIFSGGNAAAATAWLEKAVHTDPELSFAWSNLGVNYRANKMNERAEQAYLRALDLNRHEYTAMVNLARLYHETGREKSGDRFLKRADNFRKQNPSYHFSLGEEAYGEGHYKEALSHYRKAIRRKKTEHEFHFSMARAYIQLGEKEKAAAALNKAREYAPDVFNENRYYQKLDSLAFHE